MNFFEKIKKTNFFEFKIFLIWICINFIVNFFIYFIFDLELVKSNLSYSFGILLLPVIILGVLLHIVASLCAIYLLFKFIFKLFK